jgi:hypothetical protein
MKRLILLFSLLISTSLFAAPVDRDVLLTPDGTLYSVEATMNGRMSASNASMRYLALTVQNGEVQRTITVPDSLVGGNHWAPKLAYDSESKTLFLFWLRSRNTLLTNSDLVFCAYQNGAWTAPTVIDDTPFRSRVNLSVAVTRKAEMINDHIDLVVIPALTVHLAWWNESGAGNAAYYACVGIDDGEVVDMQVRPLPDLVDGRFESSNPAPAETAELFRHPTLTESANHDTVDVIFGDVTTNRFHRTTIKTFITRPQPNLRVRIPINVKDRGFGGPTRAFLAESSSVSAVPAGEDGAIFYAEEGSVVKYLAYRDRNWSSVKSIVLSDSLSAEAAVSAIRRMAAAE